MFLRCLTIFLMIFSFQCFASEIFIELPKMSLSLKINNNFMAIDGPLVGLSMQKNKCNQNIFTTFRNKVKNLLKSKLLSKKNGKQHFILKIKNESFYAPIHSALFQAFSLIPKEFHRIKIEEKMLCGKLVTRFHAKMMN